MNHYSQTLYKKPDHYGLITVEVSSIRRVMSRLKKNKTASLPPWCCSFVKLIEENINDFDCDFFFFLPLNILFHKKKISTGFQHCICQPIRICTHSLPSLLSQCIKYLYSCLWPAPSLMHRILFPLSYARSSKSLSHHHFPLLF